MNDRNISLEKTIIVNILFLFRFLSLSWLSGITIITFFTFYSFIADKFSVNDNYIWDLTNLLRSIPFYTNLFGNIPNVINSENTTFLRIYLFYSPIFISIGYILSLIKNKMLKIKEEKIIFKFLIVLLIFTIVWLIMFMFYSNLTIFESLMLVPLIIVVVSIFVFPYHLMNILIKGVEKKYLLLKKKQELLKYSKKFLGKQVDVKMDRPLGSKHPKHKFIYEVNYGFVPKTLAPDGEELDVYVLGVEKPLESFLGKCIAIIHRLDDDDDKLIVIPEKLKDISDEEIRKKTHFQEQYFKSVIIRE